MLAGALLACAGQLLMLRNQNLGPDAVLNREAGRISSVLAETRDLVKDGWTFAANPFRIRTDSGYAVQFRKAGIEVFVFRGQTPLYWTSNSYNIIPSGRTGVNIEKHYTRYLAVWSIHTDSLDYVFARDLIRNPEFKAIGAATLAEEKDNKFLLSANPLENSMPVNVSGVPLFYLVIDEFMPGAYWDLMVLLGILLFTLGWAGLTQRLRVPLLAIPFNLLLWFGVEMLFFRQEMLWNLKSTALFAPELYASSSYFPNLGVLLFNSAMAYYLVRWLWQLTSHYAGRLQRWIRQLLTLSSLVMLFLFGVQVLDESARLVRDSSINFNFHEIHLVNLFTILGLLAVVIWYATLFLFLQTIQLLEAYDSLARRRWLSVTAFIITMSWVLFSQPLWLGLFASLLFAGLMAYDLFARRHKDWVRVGLRILVPCLVTGMIFNRQISAKELEVRDILAAKLLLQNEKEPYNLLLRTENQLLADRGVVDYYTCRDETKGEFEKRLRQLYFSELSEDYEILIFDYNSAGRGYREENPFDFRTINELYSSNVCKPITGRFSLVNERKLKGSYLGKFEVYDKGQGLGTYFILLKPRISAIQGRLSDMFNKSPLEALFVENQYSYAIYNKNKLSRRYGQYNYPVGYPGWNRDTVIKSGGFSHFTYADDLGNVIVISKPVGSVLEALTGFTVLGIVSLFVTLLYYLVILIRQYIIANRATTVARLRLLNALRSRIPLGDGRDLFLSSKLQVYVTLVVFVTFLVVLVVTINYFRNNYSARQKETLWNKTNEIANAISTQANLDALFNKFQTGLVYDLSNYYSTDINLYDERGKLLISSNDRIYEQDIMGNLMNPYAFADLNMGSSGFIMDEKIGDLTYISAYYTLFDNDLNVKGYLNLPYFTNRKDLYREISYYAVTIINLFALVFALAAIVAYIIAHRITEPLNLIRQQMGLVKLGLPNAPIEWQHNDEIGLLIGQYNKMILELEESSNKLAESERQGAWREMAKQVAHEIKNPLTPMKLSLQHLQFAIQRKDENLEDKIKKTTELLINQIDTLSAMAEEFSSFAKMPEAKMEMTHASRVLGDAVGLFSREERVSFDYLPMDDHVQVMADPRQLGRVFTNIIKNAIQAIPEDRKGLIRVRGGVEKETVYFTFTDNGKGIAPELKNRIFSPNFSTKNSGMGLGLAMSRKIIEQFGGTISFESRVDQGTTFHIRLPLHKA